jgi:hypothetical protein
MIMINTFNALAKGKISRKELYRYLELHKKLIGDDKFVEIGDSVEWKEFNELTKKINNKY